MHLLGLWKYQVYPRGSLPRQLRSGMIFCAKSPTLGDKLLSNFPRGRGGAMGRGSFHAKVLVLFIKNAWGGGNLHMSRYGDVPLFWVLFRGLLPDFWVPFLG